MNEHLPECHYVKDTGGVRYGWNDCICDELRTCEERVARAFHQVRKDDTKQWEKFSRDQFDAGYAAALRKDGND
jgi:predicted trehalose synthase